MFLVEFTVDIHTMMFTTNGGNFGLNEVNLCFYSFLGGVIFGVIEVVLYFSQILKRKMVTKSFITLIFIKKRVMLQLIV